MSFTDSVRAAMAGSRSGSWKADGSRHYLAITPVAASTATVVTVTLSAGLATSYRFFHPKYGHSSTLAHNFSIGTTKIALENLFAQAPQLYPIVTYSAMAAAGTSVTIALTHPDPDQLLGGRTIEVVT